MSLLVVLLVVAPAAALGALAAIAVLGWRRARHRRAGQVDLILLSLVCACAAVIVYGYGVARADFVTSGSTYDICPDGPLGNPQTHSSAVPLAHDCLYADGRVTSLVPDWVNPVAAAALAGSLVLVVAALLIRRRGERSAPLGDPPPDVPIDYEHHSRRQDST